MIALGDLAGMSLQAIRDHIAENYSGAYSGRSGSEREAPVVVDLTNFNILIAYESVGSYGCDSSSFFLVQDADSKLYEVNGSHCSCYGFEGQWTPEETSLEALQHRANEGRLFDTGGYDDDSDKNLAAAVDYVNRTYASEQLEKHVLQRSE